MLKEWRSWSTKPSPRQDRRGAKPTRNFDGLMQTPGFWQGALLRPMVNHRVRLMETSSQQKLLPSPDTGKGPQPSAHSLLKLLKALKVTHIICAHCAPKQATGQHSTNGAGKLHLTACPAVGELEILVPSIKVVEELISSTGGKVRNGKSH